MGLIDQFKKTQTFKYFYSTSLRFDESLNCFVATEKWRDKEAELLTAAWWMFAEVSKNQVPESFVLVPKEPTLEMCHRGRNTRSFKVQDIYKAMIEAQEQSHD